LVRVLQIRITAKYVIDVSEYLLPGGEVVLEQGHLRQSQKMTRNSKLSTVSTHKHHRKQQLQKLALITNFLAKSVALKVGQNQFHKSDETQVKAHLKSPKQTKTHVHRWRSRARRAKSKTKLHEQTGWHHCYPYS
jgi:hypothetical protein